MSTGLPVTGRQAWNKAYQKEVGEGGRKAVDGIIRREIILRGRLLFPATVELTGTRFTLLP